MLWIIAASVLAGMTLGTCLGILVMSPMAVSSRVSEPIRVHDQT